MSVVVVEGEYECGAGGRGTFPLSTSLSLQPPLPHR